MKNWKWYVLALFLLFCDQLSKGVALNSLPLYQPMTVIPGLNWTLMYNPGSAFGFLSQSDVWWHSYMFTAFGILMSVGLVIWIALCKRKNKLELVALSCILSGAVGNVVDRIRLGHVIDFIQIYYKEHYFPVFNIADSAICIGAILLFLASQEITKPRKKRR